MTFDPNELKKLDPAVRTRVEAALTETLAKELSDEAGAVSRAATHSRSRGAIFSRSRTSRNIREDLVDNELINKLDSMDDDAFKKFSERLTTMRNLSSGGQ